MTTFELKLNNRKEVYIQCPPASEIPVPSMRQTDLNVLHESMAFTTAGKGLACGSQG